MLRAVVRKSIARARYRERLDVVSAARRRFASAAITEEALAAIDLRGIAGPVAAFVGVRGEPDTRALCEALLAGGRAVCLPRVTGPGTMVFHLLGTRADDVWENLVPGPHGLMEPASDWPLGTTFALALVPGLSFAGDGSRLGHGGGFYDRLLPTLPAVRRLGLCLEEVFEPHPTWTVEDHDVPVGLVVRA